MIIIFTLKQSSLPSLSRYAIAKQGVSTCTIMHQFSKIVVECGHVQAKLNFCKNLIRYTNADMKILQYIRLHIKNNITQITHFRTFHFLRCAHFRYAKCSFTNTQKQQNTLKVVYFLRKIQTLPANNLRIRRIQNVTFSGHYFCMNANIWRDFQICISVLLMFSCKLYISVSGIVVKAVSEARNG